MSEIREPLLLRGTTAGVSWVILTVAASVGPSGCLGGQSGTDGDDGFSRCGWTESAAVLRTDGAQALIARASRYLGHYELQLKSARDATVRRKLWQLNVDVDLGKASAYHYDNGEECREAVDVPGRLRVSIPGVMDWTGDFTLTVYGDETPGPDLVRSEHLFIPRSAFHEIEIPNDISASDIEIEFIEDSVGVRVPRARLRYTQEPALEFTSNVTGPRHVPLAEVAEICSSLQSVELSRFPDIATAEGSLAGSWALCDDDFPSQLAGVSIDERGSWQPIVADDGLRYASGFTGGGSLTVSESLSKDEGGLFNIYHAGLESASLSRQRRGRVEMSSDGGTLQLEQSAFVRMDRAILPARLPTFEEGTRAGLAGCASPELGVSPLGVTTDDVDATLDGSWLGCSGYSGHIRFDGAGGIELEGVDGAPPRSLSYTKMQTPVERTDVSSLIPSGATPWAIGVGDELWIIYRSLQPTKLQIARLPREPAAEPAPAPIMVLSAEPS